LKNNSETPFFAPGRMLPKDICQEKTLVNQNFSLKAGRAISRNRHHGQTAEK
jgi:hypothetical protein